MEKVDEKALVAELGAEPEEENWSDNDENLGGDEKELQCV
eukprot:gene15794-21918_t